jgi:predicted DNA-binding protein with PD1-like motif
MHSREIRTGDRRVLVVVCDQGEEALGAVTSAVREHGIRAAQVTAVGGFRGGELGYFDGNAREYAHIPVEEQVEVLSLLGDVAEQDGQPQPHLHAVLGRRDGSTVGGHLLRGEVWPTLEVIVTEVAPELAKRFDPQTRLSLISP